MSVLVFPIYTYPGGGVDVYDSERPEHMYQAMRATTTKRIQRESTEKK